MHLWPSVLPFGLVTGTTHPDTLEKHLPLHGCSLKIWNIAHEDYSITLAFSKSNTGETKDLASQA